MSDDTSAQQGMEILTGVVMDMADKLSQVTTMLEQQAILLNALIDRVVALEGELRSHGHG